MMKVQKLRFTTAIFFGLVVAIWILSAILAPRTVVLEFDEIAASDISQSNWSDICFVPPHNSVPSRFETCWHGRAVSERSTYLMLFGDKNICEMYEVKADFLIRHGADRRCFEREETEDLILSVEDGILILR